VAEGLCDCVHVVEMNVEEFYGPDDVLPSAAKYQIKYEIKITIPERIGNIYTMADRETDQGKRRNVMAYFKNIEAPSARS
jgi:hypothetical protein